MAQSVGAWTVSRRVAGSSPRTVLNMECGLLGEVPVHLLGPAVVPLSKAPDNPLPPVAPRALYNNCPLLLVLDSWY